MPQGQTQRAYWAKKKALERKEAALAAARNKDPDHPDNHHCTERTIDYSDRFCVCTVCGRTWSLMPVADGELHVWVVRPKTVNMPPMRPEQKERNDEAQERRTGGDGDGVGAGRLRGQGD